MPRLIGGKSSLGQWHERKRPMQTTPNKSLERACGHRGHAVLAMNCVLAGAKRAPCLVAQLSR